MMQKVVIVGTGLIGASVGLALHGAGFAGSITGIDRNPAESADARRIGAIDDVAVGEQEARAAYEAADVIVLAMPVLAILHWIDRIGPLLGPQTLVTDVGSTKLAISDLARSSFRGGAPFLPGHPMAGKEFGGAALAEAGLFQGAMWLFTPLDDVVTEHEGEWRRWVQRMGCRMMDLDPARHDRICAWVSHLPQMASTAMSAMFEDEFAQAPELAEEFRLIGGRALREMTRLGASPYSMWRDVAQTNTEPLAATIFALEQRLAHLRENLRTPELREEFMKANRFGKQHG